MANSRKPAATHKANGNPGKRPIRPEPEYRVVKGNLPPDWLDEIAAQEWHNLMPVLERTKVMTEGDLTAFAAYCVHYSLWRSCLARRAECGDIIVNNISGAVQASPFDVMGRQHAMLMKSFLVEFGLTPATRSKVAIVGEKSGKNSEEEEMFG